MSLKIYSNNMDEPKLDDAVKIGDIDPIKKILQTISRKSEKFNNEKKKDLHKEDIFALKTLERVHTFYMFVVIQIILVIILGVYQIFSFKKNLLYNIN
jgi:hypothetical protein